MSIRRLPDDIAGKIKSSASLTSLNGVVYGLLKNALDAGATKVNIHVDYARGNCTVEDNGCGISPGEFAEDGGLGKAHFTSKYPPNAGIHGRQGNFLASVAVLSLMTITSHHYRFNSHNSLSIHHGQVLKRHRPALPGERLETFHHGTRVAVHNLFGSMPVRVKHRAALFSNRAGIDKEWSSLTHDVVALLLAWPSEVSVSMREVKGQGEMRLKSFDTADILTWTSRLLIQASLATNFDIESWVPVSAASGHIIVKGCISLDPVATRRSQFISLGILPILNEYGVNLLYEEVNTIFKNSSFGVIEGEDIAKPRKGVDRWPMFYFRISRKDADLALDTDSVMSQCERDLEQINSLLKAVSYDFLKKHDLRPHKVNVVSSKSVFSTQTTTLRFDKTSNKRQKLLDDTSTRGASGRIAPTHPTGVSSSTPFQTWQRSKPSLTTSSHSPKEAQQVQNESIGGGKSRVERLVGEGGKLLRKPFDEPDTAQPDSQPKLAPVPSLASRDESPAGSSGDLEMTRGRKRKRFERDPKAEPSEWLRNVLKSWINPVFEPPRPLSPQLGGGYGTPACDFEEGHRHLQCLGGAARGFDLPGRVSREALKNAKVIGQVDRKFILLKMAWKSMEGEASCALVMLDQHAADERRRLEDLMGAYFKEDSKTGHASVVTEDLEQALRYEVSERDSRLLQSYKDHFKAWGIIYGVETRAAGSGCGKVTVTALPPSILERCRSQPRLLVELLRREIWKLDDEGTQPRSSPISHVGNGQAAVARFYNCPRGILELLHSRSCRSAIMFNDVLSKKECKDLVRRLARCALPFQCAHGRPSVVPLVDVGNPNTL